MELEVMTVCPFSQPVLKLATAVCLSCCPHPDRIRVFRMGTVRSSPHLQKATQQDVWADATAQHIPVPDCMAPGQN